jgi:chitin synthase
MEYKFAHVFDKALESVCGYITVLPGAFSSYSWKAIDGVPLWESYFKSFSKPEEMNAFNSNIYLAEDRVLCLALVAKKDEEYTLRYVRTSISETDVPETFQTFLAQRRRWINGSWFALIDSINSFKKINDTKHHTCRKLTFYLQLIYYIFTVCISWLMVGLLFIVMAIIIRMAIPDETGDFDASTWVINLYVALLLFTLIISLSVPPREIESLY